MQDIFKMKTGVIKLTVVVMVISIFWGCFYYKETVQPIRKNLDETETDSLVPESRYYYFTEAQLQMKTGNYDKAIQYLNKAIEKDPDSIYLRLELATLYLLVKEKHRALRFSGSFSIIFSTTLRALWFSFIRM